MPNSQKSAKLTNPIKTKTEIDQLLLEMQCRCGHYPRLKKETLNSEPAIVSFWYECDCGNRTGNFFDKDRARACWRERYTAGDGPQKF
jgi:hypothetical protein